jgi:hypothetical protein
MSSSSAGVDVSCVVHVHSTYSDGTATMPDLLSAARDTGADAVLLTDHDSLGARRDGWEGMHESVFLLVGTEISPEQGRYLAFGVDEELPHAGRTAREIAAAVRTAGGIGFAAHPFSTGGRMLVPSLSRRIVLPHGWPALDEPAGADGLELWSLTTDAAEGWRTPAEAWRWLHDPEAAVAHGPPPHHLRRWDALSARRRVPAIGGLDGHAPGIRVRGRVRSPLSHARTFGLLRTHLFAERALTGDVDVDRATLVDALRVAELPFRRACRGRTYVGGTRRRHDRPDGRRVPRPSRDPPTPVPAPGRHPAAARWVAVAGDIRLARRPRGRGTGRLPRRSAHRRPPLAALQPDPPALITPTAERASTSGLRPRPRGGATPGARPGFRRARRPPEPRRLRADFAARRIVRGDPRELSFHSTAGHERFGP